MGPPRIHGLGEIAIRCGDLEEMSAFYRDIVGLPVLETFPDAGIVFFRISEGHGGHTSVLALFRYDAGRPDLHPLGSQPPETGARSSLHHLALTVDAAAQDSLKDWLESQGVSYRVQEFSWIGWRGVFVTDPEGNTVEFVAADPALQHSEDTPWTR